MRTVKCPRRATRTDHRALPLFRTIHTFVGLTLISFSFVVDSRGSHGAHSAEYSVSSPINYSGGSLSSPTPIPIARSALCCDPNNFNGSSVPSSRHRRSAVPNLGRRPESLIMSAVYHRRAPQRRVRT